MATSINGCYARELGDCSGEVNREHYISRALLKSIWQNERGGKLCGLKFMQATKENPKGIGIDSLTAKILCESHNHRLGDYDTEITKLFDCKEKLLASEEAGAPLAENWHVSGDLIERWMLKALIGGLYSGNFSSPLSIICKDIVPQNFYLDILYMGARLQKNMGLYVNSGTNPFNDHVFQLAAIGDHSGIVGLRMWVFRMMFTLILTSEYSHFPEYTTGTYRPSRIVAKKTRNAITFKWQDGCTGYTIENQSFKGDQPSPDIILYPMWNWFTRSDLKLRMANRIFVHKYCNK